MCTDRSKRFDLSEQFPRSWTAPSDHVGSNVPRLSLDTSQRSHGGQWTTDTHKKSAQTVA